MIVFNKFFMKKNNELHRLSDSVALVLILSTKSAKGCRGVERTFNPWLANMM